MRSGCVSRTPSKMMLPSRAGSEICGFASARIRECPSPVLSCRLGLPLPACGERVGVRGASGDAFPRFAGYTTSSGLLSSRSPSDEACLGPVHALFRHSLGQRDRRVWTDDRIEASAQLDKLRGIKPGADPPGITE